MFKYQVSAHAVQRYQERCGGRGKGKVLKHNALKWANTHIPKAECLGVYEDGNTHYRYRQYEIIVSKYNVVVTISFYTAANSFVDEVTDAVKTKISRLIKPYRTMHRQLLIEMHEAEIRKLKVFNPKTQAVIDKTIVEINREITTVQNRIHDLEKLAERYNVEV